MRILFISIFTIGMSKNVLSCAFELMLICEWVSGSIGQCGITDYSIFSVKSEFNNSGIVLLKSATFVIGALGWRIDSFERRYASFKKVTELPSLFASNKQNEKTWLARWPITTYLEQRKLKCFLQIIYIGYLCI